MTVKTSVPLLFAASCAVTVMMFVPLCKPTDATLQLVVPVVNPVPPRSFDQLTAVTPRSSEDVPPIVKTEEVVAYVAADVGPMMVTVGAVVSGGVYVTVIVSVFWLAAASRALTVMVLVPDWRAMPAALQLVVPLAVPLPPRSLDQLTCVTLTLSEAVPETVKADEAVVYAIEGKDGEKGVLVGGYGISADEMTDEMAKKLTINRVS